MRVERKTRNKKKTKKVLTINKKSVYLQERRRKYDKKWNYKTRNNQLDGG